MFIRMFILFYVSVYVFIQLDFKTKFVLKVIFYFLVLKTDEIDVVIHEIILLYSYIFLKKYV